MVPHRHGVAPSTRLGVVCLPTVAEPTLVGWIVGVVDYCAMASGSRGLTLIAAAVVAILVTWLVSVLLALAENQLIVVLVHLGYVEPEQLLVVDTATQL